MLLARKNLKAYSRPKWFSLGPNFFSSTWAVTNFCYLGKKSEWCYQLVILGDVQISDGGLGGPRQVVVGHHHALEDVSIWKSSIIFWPVSN